MAQRELRHLREELAHRRAGDEARELAADAEMLAGAEAEMADRPAVDVVAVGVGEFALVAVGGAVGERDGVAFAHGLAVQRHVARQHALEALRRGVEAQRLLDRLRQQSGVVDDAPARVGKIGEVEREDAHEARQRLDAGDDEHRRGQHHLAVGQAVAVDLGLGELGDDVVGRRLAALGDLVGDERAEVAEGGVELCVAAAPRLVGRDRQHDLAAHGHRVGRRQAEHAEDHADGERAGDVGDEVEFALRADARGGLVGHGDGRRHQVLEVAPREGDLRQHAQPVVARRIGGAERAAGAAGDLVDQVAARGGEGLPVLRRAGDVVVARQDPEAAGRAPVAGMPVAQGAVERERIGVDRRRIKLEGFGGLFGRGVGGHVGGLVGGHGRAHAAPPRRLRSLFPASTFLAMPDT